MVKVIPYKEIMALLARTKDRQTRALIAFQYVSAARIGELLRYAHASDKLVSRKEPELGRIEKKYETAGLLKSNITLTPDTIYWVIPNFKVGEANKDKQTKTPFVFKDEEILWAVVTDWLATSGEQVFELRQSRARQLVSKAIFPLASHTLRRSRGTHLSDLFGFTAYDIRDYLGHVSLETSASYVSTANMMNKMRAKLAEMKIDKEGENVVKP